MFKQGDKDVMIFALAGTVMISLLAILGSRMPLVGILIYPAAIFFLFCGVKNGFIFTLPFITAAYVFAAFGTTFTTAIADVLGPALSAAVMGELLRLGRPQGEVLVKGIGVGILCELSTLICLKFLGDESLLAGLRETMQATLDEATQSGQMTIYTASVVQQTYEMLLKLIPGLTISFVIIGVVFIFFEGTAILHRRGQEMPYYFPFRDMSFPRRMIYGFLILFLLGMLAGALSLVDRNVLLVNLSLVMWTLVCIQGTAVLDYLWHRPHFPRFIYIILVILAVISTVGTVVLFVVGILDLVINFRARIDAKRGRVE